MARQVIPIPVTGGNLVNLINSNFQELYDAHPSLNNYDYEFIAPGNTGLDQDGNWKLTITADNRFVVQRYDSAQTPSWVEITEFGSSITVDKIFLITGLAAISVATDNNVYNIGRQAQTIDAIDLGDMEWKTILSSSDDLKIIKSDGSTTANLPIQPLSDEDNTAETLIEFPLVGTVYSKLKRLKVLSLDASDDIRFVVRRDNASGLVIMENKPAADFNIGVNQTPVIVGENIFDIGSEHSPIYTSPGTTQWVQVYTKTPVRWQGHTNNIEGTDYFQPRILADAVVSTSNETIATQEWVDNHITSIPTLYDFNIDINSRVPLDTNLNIQKTISYDVTNHSQITSLKVEVNGSVVGTLTIPTSDGPQSESITLSGIDTSSETTLYFRLVANDNIYSNTKIIEVKDTPEDEFIYYGIGDIDPAIVNINTLQSKDTNISTQFDVTLGLSQLGQSIVFLCPQDHDITEIINKDVFNINVISAYTKTIGVRTINTTSYNSYELSNLNPNLTFNYTIKHI